MSSDSIKSIPRGLTAFTRGSAGWRLSRWSVLLPKIAALEASLQDLSDSDLRKQSLSLRYRAKSKEPLSSLLVEAYALAREAGRRALEMRHFDVQILGGISLFHGSIAEMQTGEGKTLTATLPLYLYSLEGKGSHLATVNDYLAQRDAKWMEPLFNLLGISVGIIQSDQPQPQRRDAYACDITYGTAKEFGFDFLRDRLLHRQIREEQYGIFGSEVNATSGSKSETPVQRSSHFSLVDEADSILIDEARTPLIIGTMSEKAREQISTCFVWCADSVDAFEEDEHYHYDHEKRAVELTVSGRQLVRTLPQPDILKSVGLIEMYEYVERAIKVQRDFILDRHYVVRDDEIVIVDEFTGRLAEGRKWRDGIHQAIEAKQHLEVSMPTGQAARITVQDLFLRYTHLAGMTGTAVSSAREINKIYKCHVVPIPTNKPPRRQRLSDRVFNHSDEKWEAVVEEVKEQHALGRPVLIGTRSIDKSELLAKLLDQAGLTHQVLNAHRVSEEAEIVARAGHRGRITVATNMAGRGTDIKLGEGVSELGGLHVICTELHDSARIDRQLIGRCGRQGDPGSIRQYLSLDDDVLLNGFGPEKAERLARQGVRNKGDSASYGKIFRRAQLKVEREHLQQRSILLYHEKQRKKMHIEMGQDPYLDTPD